MERAVLPLAQAVPGIVPAVVAPVFDADDQVEPSIAVIVGVAPLVVAYLGAFGLGALRLVEARFDGEFDFFGEAGGSKVGVLEAGREYAEATLDVTGHDVVDCVA